ncbi:PREDICTED: uncharacterized protein LOC18601528 [Theobroma cacao]|uniref:Uncharacterized protein LOC18601528 n=1 Tax=Theobroma cacao TaxID=3641 RepID=A0AB32V9B9_THECC|nr:PREDICTED: uncharacterized protein LOC18601528 [Theobroma cacao]
MAYLASCWLLIESIVIPDGYFLKWFYLSFYIHPAFLFACQIFLWLKLLTRCILVVFIYPFRIISFVCSYVYRFCRNCIIYIFSFFRVTNLQVVEEVGSNLEVVKFSVGSQYQLVSLGISSSILPSIPCKTEVVGLQRDELEDANGCEDNEILPGRENSHKEDWSFCLHKDLNSDEYSSSFCISSPSIDEAYLNEYSPLFSSFSSPFMKEYSLPPAACSSGSPVSEREVITRATDEVESEEFYKKYSERMGWFDVLNHDRTCGISAILNKEEGIPSSLESIKAKDFSIPYISWSKIDKKMLLRSIKSDFELVYVAQSCLTWEALHHQYRKVKFLTFSNYLFSDDVAGEFQNFHVLLERFMEDERCYQGKRVWNYVQKRFASKSLLQVPKLSGFLEDEKERIKGETVHAKHVLKTIEECIRAFGKFVATDRKRLWWKFKSSSWTYPPVEDPRDLELLADVTRRLQKKELGLKELQGKQRCWFNKAVNPVEESQKEAILLTMIEMKLVSRVLQMSILSSAQLKWCREKLENIEFKRGRLFRTSSGPLFPSC